MENYAEHFNGFQRSMAERITRAFELVESCHILSFFSHTNPEHASDIRKRLMAAHDLLNGVSREFYKQTFLENEDRTRVLDKSRKAKALCNRMIGFLKDGVSQKPLAPDQGKLQEHLWTMINCLREASTGFFDPKFEGMV